VAHLTPQARSSQKILYTGEFLDQWTDDCLRILSASTADPWCRPVVLLPNDIQAEDYAPYCEVRVGFEASRALEHLTHRDVPIGLNCIFIDFAPDLFPDHDILLPVLNACLQGDWLQHLALVVFSPSLAGLHVEGFDALRRLPS